MLLAMTTALLGGYSLRVQKNNCGFTRITPHSSQCCRTYKLTIHAPGICKQLSPDGTQ